MCSLYFLSNLSQKFFSCKKQSLICEKATLIVIEIPSNSLTLIYKEYIIHYTFEFIMKNINKSSYNKEIFRIKFPCIILKLIDNNIILIKLLLNSMSETKKKRLSKANTKTNLVISKQKDQFGELSSQKSMEDSYKLHPDIQIKDEKAWEDLFIT